MKYFDFIEGKHYKGTFGDKDAEIVIRRHTGYWVYYDVLSEDGQVAVANVCRKRIWLTNADGDDVAIMIHKVYRKGLEMTDMFKAENVIESSCTEITSDTSAFDDAVSWFKDEVARKTCTALVEKGFETPVSELIKTIKLEVFTELTKAVSVDEIKDEVIKRLFK